MKFFVSLILIALLSLAAELYLPFWSVAIVAFGVSALIPQSSWKSFVCGFCALFLLWAGLALCLDVANDHILATRMSQLILKVQSPILLVAVTGFLGGLVGGMASLSASFLQSRAAASE